MSEQEPEESNVTSADFDAFLKEAARKYFLQHGKRNPADFAALLVALGGFTTASMAWDSFRSGDLPKRLAFGAAGAVALRYGLRYALSGPLGVVAAGLTVFSLTSYLVRQQGEVTSKAARFREIIEEGKGQFDRMTEGFGSRLNETEREMILEGLRSRFVGQLLAVNA